MVCVWQAGSFLDHWLCLAAVGGHFATRCASFERQHPVTSLYINYVGRTFFSYDAKELVISCYAFIPARAVPLWKVLWSKSSIAGSQGGINQMCGIPLGSYKPSSRVVKQQIGSDHRLIMVNLLVYPLDLMVSSQGVIIATVGTWWFPPELATFLHLIWRLKAFQSEGKRNTVKFQILSN